MMKSMAGRQELLRKGGRFCVASAAGASPTAAGLEAGGGGVGRLGGAQPTQGAKGHGAMGKCGFWWVVRILGLCFIYLL